MATADYPQSAAGSASSTTSSAEAASTLRHNLNRLTSRRNQQTLWREVARSLMVGTGLAAVAVLAHRFYLVDGEWWMPALLLVAALAIGIRNGLSHRSGLFAAAIDADQSLGLQDRLSSALAFVQPDAVRRAQPVRVGANWWARLSSRLAPRVVYQTSASAESTQLVPALVQDAAARSATLDPRRVYPAKLDRTTQLLALFTVLLIAFSLMPNIPWLLSKEDQKQRKVTALAGDKLVAIAKDVRKKQTDEPNEDVKRMTKRIDSLGKKMQRGRITKRAALTEMGQLRKDMEKAAKNDRQNGLPNMEQAMKAMRDEPMQTAEGKKIQEEIERGNLEKAAQQMEKLAAKVEKSEKMSPQEREKAANDMEKAAKALKQQGSKQADEMAKQLEQAAQGMRQGNQQQGQKQGNQQQQGQQGGQQQGSQQGSNSANSRAADALRKMAQGMRQGGTQSGNGQSLQDMLNKIQEAEKDAGENSGGQSGSGKDGKGKGQGEGEGDGEGVTPGKDLLPSTTGPKGGAGLGPRSGNQPHSSGGGVSDMKTKGAKDTRRWEDVWSDRLPKTRQKIDRVKGKWGNEGETEQLPTRGEAQNGPVKTPYYEVYESYKKDAEDAVSKETIPPAYKQPVKEYFESLKPNP